LLFLFYFRILMCVEVCGKLSVFFFVFGNFFVSSCSWFAVYNTLKCFFSSFCTLNCFSMLTENEAWDVCCYYFFYCLLLFKNLSCWERLSESFWCSLKVKILCILVHFTLLFFNLFYFISFVLFLLLILFILFHLPNTHFLSLYLNISK
jgi:hypothetical protein